jgi:hypothetical protein
MLLKSVYDLIGAFGIVGTNDPFAIGTVEKQHVSQPPFSIHLLKPMVQFVKKLSGQSPGVLLLHLSQYQNGCTPVA